MPFDPSKPADHSALVSAEMRAQLTGLKDLIDAVPAGPPGPAGSPGIPGPPFADAVVDSVTTLNPGDSATVGANYDGIHVRFTFGIPRGATGGDGAPGPSGPPGEVTNAALSAALAMTLAGTSSNSNTVGTLDTPFANDPPTLADIEVLRAKINEMLLALRR